MGVQEVRRDKGGTTRTREYYFLWKKNENHQFLKLFCVNHRIISAVI
jgi:hypothetical protein